MLSEGKLRKTRVKLSTIHSAKGGEADNVLLMIDKRTKEHYKKA